MSVHEVIAGALPAVAALAALGAVTGTRAAEPPTPRADLQALAGRAVLFGHQSVGQNLLDGLARLAAREGVTLDVKDVTSAPPGAPVGISHAFVGRNRDPEAKLADFARRVDAVPVGTPVVALVKLCYVDVTADTDVAALFARYRATIDGLRQRHPGVVFVHVTVPLTTVEGGAKRWMKRLSGKPPYGLAENARREAYNDLLRGAYQGREPLLDLAAVESTRPDGSRETLEWKGRQVPALASAWAFDDGHLNEAGQDHAARALARVLAAARP